MTGASYDPIQNEAVTNRELKLAIKSLCTLKRSGNWLSHRQPVDLQHKVTVYFPDGS